MRAWQSRFSPPWPALVGGFNKISDKFVDEFLTKDGETVEHAKARLAQEQAAKVTFLNVLLLSLLCTVIDGIRRKIMVDRPVRKITSAAEQIMKGDFSVRIPPIHTIDSADGFGTIAECLNKMAQELAGMETLRTDFIANVSHELKTPLAVIQNYGTMLQQPDLPEEKRLEYAKSVTEASHRLANLITNILKLNKLENQQIYPKAETYDLGEQLCACLLTFENAWESKALEIDTDVEEGVLVDADAELLSLVWNNLFSNAIKFTEPGGEPRAFPAYDGRFCRRAGFGHRLRYPARGGAAHL